MNNRHLVLHVGLPKTATTALQFWCDQNRERLIERGVLYPEVDASQTVPKHQYVVGELLRGEFPRLRAQLETCEQPVLLLSSEGLSNHFYDFPEESFSEFRKLLTELGYSLSIFLVFRSPEIWLRSYYKQAVLNPTYRKFEWGTSKTFQEFAELPRVRRLTDLDSLRVDMSTRYGGEVHVANYEDGWVSNFSRLLGVSEEGLGLPPRVHGSVSDEIVEVVRQINGMGLSKRLRASVLAGIQECYRTNHGDLAEYRLECAFGSGIIKAISVDTEEQQAVVDKLLAWHASRMRRTWLGRWRFR